MHKCPDGACCPGDKCKRQVSGNYVDYFCSKDCINENQPCKSDDGCCYGIENNIFLFRKVDLGFKSVTKITKKNRI